MKNNKNIIIATSLGLMLLVGGLFTTGVLAAENSENSILTRVAAILNINQDDLEDAFKTAKLEQIDEDIAEGRIDAEKGAEIKEKIESGEFEDRGGKKRGPKDAEHRPRDGKDDKRGPKKGHMKDMVGSVADFLGVDVDTMKEAARSGKTLSEIASENGRTEEELKSFLVDEITTKLTNARNEGEIPEEKADKMLEGVDGKVDEMINKNPSERMHKGEKTLES